MTEAELIIGCGEQNRKSQRLLFEKFAGKMLSLCTRYCNSRPEAEDVLQEGFIKIFERIKDYRGDGSFEGWMRRIFVNTALSALRKKQLQFSENLEDHYNDYKVEAVALNKLTENEILALVKELPQGYRIVFNMHAVEGFSHKQIAEMLNITESTSRTQYLKARNALQAKLKSKSLTTIYHD